MDMTDDVKAVIEDTQNERDILAARQDKAAKLEKAYADAQNQANDALAQQQKLQSKVTGELAVLVAQQQQQQAQASASAAAAAANNATQNDGQDASSSNGSSSNGSSSNGTQSSSGGSRPRPQNVAAPRTRPAPPTVNVPRDLAGGDGGGARCAQPGRCQLPVRAAQPGVAFDCSGLTMWAWAQAGVSLPHYSKAQYEVLPHVPLSAIRPGDLVFFYSDIHHVGIYIGNGAMVDAANPALGVRIAGIGGAIGAARP